ncbi:cysteine hydrolase family protein [Galactobacter valiniphilus]|uniref:cysteine hydrolase family protein n=1 Tax=Galactobacter valiniphilus TaxID=2676122 RepID=UPI0038991869
MGENPRLVLTGVSTDCCVLSTALAAADGGAWASVVSDGCAASTPQNGAAALHVMGLYPPQLRVLDSAALLAELAPPGAAG